MPIKEFKEKAKVIKKVETPKAIKKDETPKTLKKESSKQLKTESSVSKISAKPPTERSFVRDTTPPPMPEFHPSSSIGASS